MKRSNPELSRQTFDQLVARAVELDDGNERINRSRAEEIVAEVGISATAWDAALQERTRTSADKGTRRFQGPSPVRTLSLAVAGLIVGGSFRAASALFTIGDIYGLFIVAASLGAVIHGIPRRSARALQVELATWWLAVAVGLAFGFGRFDGRSLLFVSLPWAASATLTAILTRLLHRDKAHPSPLATP